MRGLTFGKVFTYCAVKHLKGAKRVNVNTAATRKKSRRAITADGASSNTDAVSENSTSLGFPATGAVFTDHTIRCIHGQKVGSEKTILRVNSATGTIATVSTDLATDQSGNSGCRNSPAHGCIARSAVAINQAVVECQITRFDVNSSSIGISA